MAANSSKRRLNEGLGELDKREVEGQGTYTREHYHHEVPLRLSVDSDYVGPSPACVML